jgi:hypothetical protein
VIETLGSVASGYKARKAITHMRMERIGPLVRHCAHLRYDKTSLVPAENQMFRQRLIAVLSDRSDPDRGPCPHSDLRLRIKA